MARISDVYGGRYLNAADLPAGKRLDALVHDAGLEKIGREQEEKITLGLANRNGQAWPKRLVLNKVNSLALATAFGDETDLWPGRSVTIWQEPTMYAGQRVAGIRIEPTSTTAVAAIGPQARPEASHEPQQAEPLNDQIPF